MDRGRGVKDCVCGQGERCKRLCVSLRSVCGQGERSKRLERVLEPAVK